MTKIATKYIIYEVLNLKNRKFYIGRTKGKGGIKSRWSVHSSKFRGVSKHKQTSGGYCWETRKDKKRYRGFSMSELEAAQLYDKTALMLLGEKAKTNFPKENYLTTN